MRAYVAPKIYPAAIGVWRSTEPLPILEPPCWAFSSELRSGRAECHWHRIYNGERPHSAIGNKAPIELVNRSLALGRFKTEQVNMKPGLYYPYIHIRDIDWLKGALLIFPKVYRIVPRGFNRWDDPASSNFAYKGTSEGPLLDAAYTYHPAIERAAEALLVKLRRDADDPKFLARLQKPSAHEQREKRRVRLNAVRAGLGDSDDTVKYGAQIHREKFCESMIQFLEDHNLCWKPDDVVFEPDDPDMYVEVHEHLAEVIISTVSIAFSNEKGADIVSDDKYEQLHRFLVERRYEDLYNAWLHPEWPSTAAQQTGRRAFEFLLEWQGNVKALTADKIIELAQERDAISDLLADLDKRASKIDSGDQKTLDEQMKAVISDVLRKWQEDRRLRSRWWKEFVGADAVPLGADFFKSIAEKGAAPVTAGVSAGAYAGSLHGGGLVVGGIGLAIGVVAHGISSLAKAVKAGRRDPHRYLTSLTNAGVKLNVPISMPPESKN